MTTRGDGMKQYLIKDWTESETTPPKYSIVGESSLFSVIDDAKRNNKLIAVYEIGDCVIDWS